MHQRRDELKSPLGLFVEMDRSLAFVVPSRKAACDPRLLIIDSAGRKKRICFRLIRLNFILEIRMYQT